MCLDITPSVSGNGKIAFWDTWKLLPEITPIFAKQSSVIVSVEIAEENYKLTEKLFIILYSKEKQLGKAAVFRQLVFSTRES